MFYDSQHRALRTMAPQTSPAPVALAASQVDFAHHAVSQQAPVIGFNNLAYELVARRSRKTVVASLQFQVGVADAAAQQANPRKAFRAPRQVHAAHTHTSRLQMKR